jgi:NAD(P)-dependent dehydrogenase (short-subunit alcohol dehydrogenase family)
LRIWFITGTSSGFGYRLAAIALSRGDRVLATARSLDKLQKLVDVVAQDPDQTKKDRLKTFRLDLSDSEETIRDTVQKAVDVWGRIDVLVNNAGTIFPIQLSMVI